MSFTVDGLISGFDTTAIVEGALALRQARIDRLNVQKQELAQEQSVFGTIEGQLLGLQGSLRSVLRSTNNAFDGRVATSSDEEAVAVSASAGAAPGLHRVRVSQLAQAHQISSNEYATRSDEIPTGTFRIRTSGRAEAAITVDADNNTLQGLADSINAASDDVSATIIDDGSNSETPLRLLLTSRHTGTSGAIEIEHNLGARRLRGEEGGGSESAVTPDFTGPEVQAAQDAQLQIGSGAGAITVSSENNQFDELFDGITIDALRADPDKEISINVTEDSESVIEAVEGFVDSYNQVIEFIDGNSTFNTETNEAGILLGNRTASVVQSRLRNAVGGVVEGIGSSLRTLSSIGVTTDLQGRLSLNRSELQDIVTGKVEGSGIDDIRRLFAIDGQSDNPGVEFLLGTNNTKASPIDSATGEPIPYQVEINRAASSASLLSDAIGAGDITITGANDAFSLELDGVDVDIAIPHDVYTQEALAEQLQSLINTAPDIGGREIRLTASGGQFRLESASVGTSSIVKILEGTALSDLGLSGTQNSVGTDVSGVFRVNVGGDWVTEQATGNGRILTGRADNDYTAQLQVRSRLTESQIDGLTDANLSVTRGIGAALDDAISDLLDDDTGELANNKDRFERQTATIDDDIDRAQTQLDLRRDSLLREFASLEGTIADLQSVGNSLTGLL